jgi:iron(III) transport system ATP-binding protein
MMRLGAAKVKRDEVIGSIGDPGQPAIEIYSLAKSYITRRGPVVAVNDVSLVIGKNEFICLLGPSGCGKTTTLRCLAGLERPDSGLIKIGGRVVYDSSLRQYVSTERRGLGMVFQSYAIWPHMSVFDNVAYPLRQRARRGTLSREELKQRVRSILETVDCADLEARRPGELSGGQQQRVALARALVYEPQVLLFDEPLSNLDAKLRDRMRFELRMIQERANFTALYVTHDQSEALSLSDRIAVMAHGKIRQIGSPEDIYQRPVDAFVADFIGAANIIPVLASSVGHDQAAPTALGLVRVGSRSETLDGPTSDAAETGVELAEGSDDQNEAASDAGSGSGTSDLRLVVRPGQVELLAENTTRTDNTFEAVVLGRAYHGETMIYTLRAKDVQLRVVSRDRRDLALGDTILFRLPPEHCRLVRSGGFVAHI